MRQVFLTATAVLGALVVSACALRFSALPWFWVGLAVSSAAFVIATGLPESLKLATTVVGSLPIALALAEMVVTGPPEVVKKTVPQLDQRDSLLGWRPGPSVVSRATATVNGETVYDVVYSIDQTGHRVSPPERATEPEGCVFFFADSFMYGEGVGDRDALPYKVGVKTQGRFRVINYAFSGYGAEHMLAIVERGELAASNTPCEPTHIVYAALPHHVLRAAAKTDFSARGPRYRLGSNGTPEYVGTHPDPPVVAGWRKRLTDQLSKSRVYRALTVRAPETSQADIDLYFAIVKQAFRLIAQRWPGARIDLISWDLHDFYARDLATFHHGLESLGVTVHFIEQILPGYTQNPLKFSLHPAELHPNPLAYDMVASYLVEHVLTTPSSQERLAKLKAADQPQTGSPEGRR